MTTIKRSKATDQNIKSFGDKTSTNNQRIKEISNQIAESLYATQAKLAKMRSMKDANVFPGKGKNISQKPEALLKYKMRSKEELKFPMNAQIKNTTQKKIKNGLKRKATAEKHFENESTLHKDSLDSTLKQRGHTKKKMSEDTYIESKSSLTNIIKKKRKNLMGKKWRREVKQQVDSENMFKRSKEKALFSH